MRYLFTADTHYGHGNIIKYCNRPFSSSQEMNEKMIANHNMRVKDDDVVFFVGDFCFKSGVGSERAQDWLSRLNGQKVMVRGNHDNNNSTKTHIHSILLDVNGRRMNLVHKPEHANPNVDINIVGHVHDKWRIRTYEENYAMTLEFASRCPASDKNSFDNYLKDMYCHRNSQSILINVGVDVQRFMPVTLDEVLGQITKWRKDAIPS